MIKSNLQSPSQFFLIIIAVLVGLLFGISSIWISPVWTLSVFVILLLLTNVIRRPGIFFLLYLLMTSTFVYQTKVESISIGIGTVYLTDILLMFPLGLILIRRMMEPEFQYVHTPVDLPIFIFAGASILATSIAIYNGSVTLNQSLGEARVVASYTLFFVITNLVRNKKSLVLVIRGFLLLASVVGIATILQYLLGNSVIFLAGRLETVSAVDQATRVIPLGQSMLVVAFLFVFTFIVIEKAKFIDVIRLGQLGILGVAILITYFRASWVMIGCDVLLLGLLVRYQEMQRLVLWLSLLAITSVIILVFIMQNPASSAAKLVESAYGRLSTLTNPGEYSDPNSSLRWRDFEYSYALPHIVSTPFGLGLGATYRPYIPPKDWEGFDGRAFIHNGYLWVLMKSGWAGFLGLALFLLIVLYRGFRYWQTASEPYLRAIVLAFALSILAVIVVSNVEPYIMTASWTPVIAVMAGINEVIIGRSNLPSFNS